MTIIVENRKYPVIVDYDQSIEQLIQSGHYQKVGDDVTSSNFPSNEKGKITIEIMKLRSDSKSLTTEEAITEMASRSLRPATLRELLALKAKFVDIERQGAITAFGSSFRRDSELRYPCLFRTKLGCHFDMMGDGHWSKDIWSFAAVSQ